MWFDHHVWFFSSSTKRGSSPLLDVVLCAGKNNVVFVGNADFVGKTVLLFAVFESDLAKRKILWSITSFYPLWRIVSSRQDRPTHLQEGDINKQSVKHS